ncbi:hypothetical protein ABPG74_002540 [Tetrahymena malaccensis]
MEGNNQTKLRWYQQIPQYSESQILVARSIIKKGKLETLTDTLLSLGNQRYLDTYYQLKKKGEQTYIYEVQHINEIFADDIRALFRKGPNEFDIRDLVEYRMKHGNQFYLDQKNSTYNINRYMLIQLLKPIILFQISKQYKTQIYKVMNNALIKKNLKQFIVIGGRKKMEVLNKIVMKQGGKVIGNAIVQNVGFEGGKRASLTAQFIKINWKFLGFSLVGQIAYSLIKADLNSRWIPGEKEVLKVDNEFNFTQIYQGEQMYLDDRIIMELLNQYKIDSEKAIQKFKKIKSKL